MKLLLFALVLLAFFFIDTAHAIDIASDSETKTVEIGKQIQIAADLKNGQDIPQNFAYIVQIQNEDGITVSLSWITGQLAAAQAFSPSISWTPNEPGLYEATIFVWESVNNPTALSPTLTLQISVESSA
ncbi:hypothetical protein [Candidatus Nitrosotenuis uzonensis]|uniref:Intracellular proteinase inhibitor BsuPI domain-containing protein n=1 Tax=Candidatus Nitrosotenuis uzonensis TaxID=1407055 RepID=V6AST5_9ARCH|nr:hypothetical protein [Candidatus Nitrosotenuis uzonensis]CDI05523.1 exported hypothetical protein [Candidatus Nitrosotenuis uzonensis]